MTRGGCFGAYGSAAEFRDDEAFAKSLDAADPLAPHRARFHHPLGADAAALTYFCGNSLGLQPKSARAYLDRELNAWAAHGVEAHFRGEASWYSYHELFREMGARLVGAHPGEVVMMNSLTTNLHLMMVSFYRPTAERYKILMEDAAFPSDVYAVRSQLHYHGLDPDDDLIVARPRPGEAILRTDDLESLLQQQGQEIALVVLGGVNYYTGQLFDLARVTAAAQRQGCRVGLDLAHAAGNVVLELHDWNVDFAVWCSYKYLNAGPGAPGGCFVHARHARAHDLPRFAGWWGNDPETRFQMHLQQVFTPRDGADGWQLSNPAILAMAPLRASLEIFDEVGMAALREKSVALTGFLQFLLERGPGGRFEIITPRDPAARGCQLSIRVIESAEAVFETIRAARFVCDYRRPDVIRAAPVPLYNTFHEVWLLARVLTQRGVGARA